MLLAPAVSVWGKLVLGGGGENLRNFVAIQWFPEHNRYTAIKLLTFHAEAIMRKG